MSLVPKNYYLNPFWDNFDNWITPNNSNFKCDIYEKDGNYHIEVDIPGFDKKDIKIEEDNGYLTISAKKTYTNTADDKNYIHRERKIEKYQRSFYIGDVKEENINAEYTNGTLSVIVPKTNEVNNLKHNIQIK